MIEEIKIPLSKTKIVMLLFGAIFMTIVSFGVFQITQTQNNYDSQAMKIISIIGIIFFGYGIIYAFIKIFDLKPGLVINNEGIIDNSSAISVGKIRWENITDVYIVEISGQKILTIEVNNAEELISRQSGYKKKIMTLNNSLFNSPVQISSNILKCNLQDLYKTIKEQLAMRNVS